MKAAKTIIAWQPNDPMISEADAPRGAIAVGPLDGDANWDRDYLCTGGAMYGARHNLDVHRQKFHVLRDWYELVYGYGLDPVVVHRAFLLIDEYQEIIKDMGMGPAKGEIGHDPEIGYGRAITPPIPRIHVFKRGRSSHFWPDPQGRHSQMMKPEEAGAF